MITWDTIPLAGSDLNVMPNPPMITEFDDEGKVIGDRQGYWIEKFTDGYQLRHNEHYQCYNEKEHCFEIGNFATQSFNRVIGVDKLFHSTTPNTGHVTSDDGKCFQFNYEGNGKRQLILGSPDT